MRFEETPGLFGSGLGYSTMGWFRCEICCTIYNSHVDEEAEDFDDTYSDSEEVWRAEFLGMDVAGCCFERVECFMLACLDEGDLLPWYGRILESRLERLEEAKCDLQEVQELAGQLSIGC